MYHSHHTEVHQLALGDLVLLFNSRLMLFPGIHKSKWLGPDKVGHVVKHRDVKLEYSNGTRFKVNGQRIKLYFRNADEIKIIEV